jgi:hypothetical protein
MNVVGKIHPLVRWISAWPRIVPGLPLSGSHPKIVDLVSGHVPFDILCQGMGLGHVGQYITATTVPAAPFATGRDAIFAQQPIHFDRSRRIHGGIDASDELLCWRNRDSGSRWLGSQMEIFIRHQRQSLCYAENVVPHSVDLRRLLGADDHLLKASYHGISFDASFKGLWPAMRVDFPGERR